MLTLVADCFGRTMVFPLREDVPEIGGGSLPDNAVYLPFKGVSRHHFRLTREKGQWVLRDLESKNGTLLNGTPVSEATLQTGDIIQAGIIQLRAESIRSDSEPIRLSKFQEATDQTETDKVGHLPLSGKEPIYSFPKLIFPEGYIIGKSGAMFEIYGKLQSVVDSDINVLLYGETGVGKEMVARTLHFSSQRAQGPFIAVNCAAIPTDLAEAELFGIGERVATNVAGRKGKMVLADKGSLFLDELSSFPMALQAKVLRAIEERIVYPVGDHRPQKVDFRLVSATNQDPRELIRVEKLREDLYHRIATVEFHIPPLRERQGDIEILIMGLLDRLSQREKKQLPGISKRLFAFLCEYNYPGNVRELVNLLSAMVALAHPGEVLDVHLLPDKVRDRSIREDVEDLFRAGLNQESIHLHETIDEMTKKLVEHALKLHRGNITRAAGYLNVTPYGLRKMIKRLGIKKDAPDE